jgi:putative heme-binding domain-containing protein
MGFLNEHLALRGLIDPDENIRIAALQESERLMGGGMVSDTLWNQLHIMAGDASPAVRYQLALSLGQVGRPERVDLLAGMLNNDPENPWLRFAVLSSLGDSGARLLADLASDANWRNNPSQRRFIIELAGMIGVQGYLDDIGAAIDFVENGRLPALAWFDVLYGLGEGLRRTGSSLQLVDRQNRLHIFYDSATTAMFNGDWSVADRVAAIRFRSVTPIVSGTTDDMLQLLFGTRQPEGVEQAIASTSGRYDNPQLFDSLINSWQSLSAASRSEALASMLTRGFRLHQVVAGLQGGMVRPNEFTSVQLNFLRTYHDPSVSGAALKILGPIRTERPDVLKDFGPAAAMGGNAASGRGIFAARCASCHTPGPAASVCGPDLRTLRPFGKAVLLNAIIQPSARIRRGFSTYVLDTKESDIYYGIVRDENLLTVSIRQSNGETAVIPRNNIDVLQQQPWSLMPDGLEQGLSVQSMADLLEYLSGPTNP